jgi:hypothetical protein
LTKEEPVTNRFLLLVLTAALPAVASGQTVTCDRFEPNATLHGSELTVFLDTDLPDWTQIMVSVSRSYWAGVPLQEYPIAYVETKSTVGEWRKPHALRVDHGAWRRRLDEQTRRVGAAGIAVKVAKIDNDVTVSFTVPINQADPRFGPANRNLIGKKVAATGLRVVRAERKVRHPFAPGAEPTTTDFAALDGLKTGAKYQISRETPLMPERHSADPLRAIAAIRRVPAGAILTVLEVDRSDPSNPWYRVSAVSARGTIPLSGWLNSDALIGQEIRVVRP